MNGTQLSLVPLFPLRGIHGELLTHGGRRAAIFRGFRGIHKTEPKKMAIIVSR